MSVGVDWAIFSDKSGIWFPNEAHVWYEKSPNEVSAVTDYDLEQRLIEYTLKALDKHYELHDC